MFLLLSVVINIYIYIRTSLAANIMDLTKKSKNISNVGNIFL